MPHVSIKHFSRTFTEAEKAALVTSMTDLVTRVFGSEPGAVSIAVEQLLTVDQLAHTFSVYPSLSGSLTEAARRLMMSGRPRTPFGEPAQ